MAKNFRYRHISSVIEDKKPQALLDGEIAVNRFAGKEKLYISNSEYKIVSFIGEKEIEERLEEKQDLSGMSAYSTSNVTDGISGAVEVHITDGNIHVTAEEKSNWDNAVESSHTHANKSILDSISGAIGTMAYENISSYSSATDVNEALLNKADSSALTQANSAITEHITNGDIHVTTEDKDRWDNAAESSHTHDNKSYLDSISGDIGTMAYENISSYSSATDVDEAISDFFDGVKYEESGETDVKVKVINFYHGDTVKATIDASDFIKDGMVDNVEIKTIVDTADTSITITVLAITFNVDAGKEEIDIPLTNIFNPSNYYTKEDLTGETSDVIVTKANSAATALVAESANTVDISNVSGADDLKAIENLSGTTGVLKKTGNNEWVLDTTEYVSNSSFTAHTTSNVHLNETEKANLDLLEGNIEVISGITSSDINNWNSTSGTVTSVKIELPLGLSAATTEITTIGEFDIEYASGYSIPTISKQENWDNAVESSHTHHNKSYLDSISGDIGTMAYENISSYSSATDVDEAISDINALVGSGFTSSSITDVIISNKVIVSAALNDLEANKLDVSAYTPVDLSNYYTKAEIDEDELAISASLNDLNDSKLDVSAYTPVDLSDYYTSSQTDAAIETAVSGKLDTSAYTPTIIDQVLDDTTSASTNAVATQAVYKSITDNKTEVDNLVGSGFTSSSITDVIISDEKIVSAALNDLEANKLDVSAYTPVDLSNYYTSAQTDAAIETAVSGKLDTSAYTPTIIDQVLDDTTSASTNAVATQAVYKSITDNKTEVDNLVGSGFTSSSITDVIISDEKIVSAALNDLNDNKANKTDLGGLKLVAITQSVYDSLLIKDNNTLYVIIN